jgi:hypothetical protein
MASLIQAYKASVGGILYMFRVKIPKKCQTRFGAGQGKWKQSLEGDGWKEFYPNALEEIPDGMPTPFGKKVQITSYLDTDHAHDTVSDLSISNGNPSIHQ